MKDRAAFKTPVLAIASVLIVLSGCATRPAPDFGGRWKAVNRYAEAPDEIPLYNAYSFHASPMDGTLKNMLTRWANDSKMTLAYQHPSDFTLYGPVARIQTRDLQSAVSQLNDAYAAQNLSVAVSNNQIVVSVRGAGMDAAAANNDAH